MKVWAKIISCLSASPLKKLQYRTTEFSDKSTQTNAEKTSAAKENQNHAIQELSTAIPTDITKTIIQSQTINRTDIETV